jgi:hypothetical protein
MKKLLAAIVLVALFAAPALFAVEGQLTDVSGKVEVRGADGVWRPVSNGSVVSLADTISTGFNSSATLKLGTNNVLIRPLTRMVLDEYVEREGTVSTSLHLRVGSVRASVDSSKDINQRFEVTSPYSTASVRGTVFDYNGLNLQVLEGVVALRLGVPNRPQNTRAAVGQQEGEDESDEGEDESGDDGSSDDQGDETSGDDESGDDGADEATGGDDSEQGEGSGQAGEAQDDPAQTDTDGSGSAGSEGQEGSGGQQGAGGGAGGQDDGNTILVGAGGQVVINNPGGRSGGKPVIRSGDQVLNDNSNVNTDTSNVGGRNGGGSGEGDDQNQRPQTPKPTTGTVQVEWTWREE